MKQLAANSTTTVAQALTPSKNDMRLLSGFIRENTKKHWKPVAGAVFLGTCVYGAIKIRSEILLAREELKIAPDFIEIRNLTHTAGLVDSNCGPDHELGDLDSLAEQLLVDLEDAPELEDCLENDPTASEDTKWTSGDVESAIVDCQINLRKYSIGGKGKIVADDSDSEESDSKSRKNAPPDSIILDLISKKVDISRAAYHKEQYKKQRKRVRTGQLNNAIRGLVAKIRGSFPIPDGSALQQKAMCLYAQKECRKMCIREMQLALMVPKAVALASVPTTSQVDLRQIVKIEPVQLKYNKMAWSGYKNKQGWLASLGNLFA